MPMRYFRASAMASPDESAEVPTADESQMRAMLGKPAYLGAVTNEIRDSYSGKITQEGIAAHFGIVGKKPQARVSDWFRLNKPPPDILQQPERMLKLLESIGLDIKSLWETVTTALARTCVNPNCPSILFYAVGNEAVARPSDLNGGNNDSVCCWCRKDLQSICECGRPIGNGAFCQCGVQYVSGIPRSLNGLKGDRLRVECEKLNALNASIRGESPVVLRT